MVKIKPDHEAIKEGRTVFTSSVKSSDDAKILKPASTNTKLGNGKYIIKKGRLKGLPVFTITLEERKTCPQSCFHWENCYGNNLYLAQRISHSGKFETNLVREVEELSKKYPRGFLVRLHVLGDFYSVNYIRVWGKLLKEHENLNIFGYTAYTEGPRKNALNVLRKKYKERFILRESSNNSFDPEDANMFYACDESFEGEAITCPHVTKKVKTCLDCALCWEPNFTKTIRFPTH